ncbi:alpha/beta hydrolase [Hoeflea sp. WL0058]|uniref:Alpha/beta hydrolase n=1 Tax=Flavimaribacter sediminis TaxID=2865987 RepID=A0AAE2ZL62_9HYPH|nr:alpha/beta hydrolase [Flavimaribacter sediminis]MBW8638854.1 alpha/beta hydrolase [Flavimaribacter sediminis]
MDQESVRTFTTSDGVALNFLDTGSGMPLVMLHGWSQCLEEFRFQIEALRGRNRVIALDQRGHGGSEKPHYGYRVSRLAQDLRELLEFLEIDEAALLGHSMGCSVIWAYLDQYGASRVDRLVLVDEPPCLAINPYWEQEKIDETGSAFQPTMAFEVAHRLAGEDGEQATREMIRSMFTSGAPPETIQWVIDKNLLMPRDLAARLLLSNIFNDWRDVIPRIVVPSLVIGGEASVVSPRATRWIAENIVGSRLEMFSEAEGGSHFMFIENPDRFNRVVGSFLGQ